MDQQKTGRAQEDEKLLFRFYDIRGIVPRNQAVSDEIQQ